MNIGVHVSSWIMVISIIYPIVGLQGHMVALFLVFTGISILFAIVTISVYVPTNSAWGFLLLHILSSILMMAILTYMRVIPHCSFDLHFFSDERCLAFLCIYWPPVCLLFTLFMGFSRKEYWSGLPFFPPVDHVLSEHFIMTCPSWLALHGMAHSFIDLYKAVIHIIIWVSLLWLWFLFWRLWECNCSFFWLLPEGWG